MSDKIIAPNPDALQESKKQIGELVYQARKASGVSQAKLGSTLGVSEDTIASLEHGEFFSFDLFFAAFQHYHLSLNRVLPGGEDAYMVQLQDAMDSFMKLLIASEKQMVALQHKLK